MTTDQRIIERQNEFLKKIEIYKLHNVHHKVTRDKFGNILAVEEVEEVERQQTINPFMAGFVSKVTKPLEQQLEEPDEPELEEETEEFAPIWEVPIPTRKEFIRNKAVDYRILGGLMLRSNSNAQFDFIEGMNNRGRRYIMGHKMDKVIEEIAQSTINPKTKKPLTKSAVSKHIRTLKKLGAREFSIATWNDKLYYDLQFGEVDENGKLQGGDFVTISSNRLKDLTNAYSSLSIKIYTIMLWKCWDNKNQCYKETQIPYEALMQETGINDKTVIHSCIWALENKFITVRKEKRREHILDKTGEVRSVIRAYNYFNIIEY